MTLEIISAHEDHAPLISVLVKGKMKYTGPKGEVEELEIAGGLADVNNNVISVCVY